MPPQHIYLDYNATTPLDSRVFEEMRPFLTDYYCNPSSNNSIGKKINQSVEQARLKVAELINSEPSEIIFTSSATEAINLAIKGIADSSSKKNHIITVSTEHPAVLETCRYLETKGFEITYLSVNEKGLIDLKMLRESIKKETLMLCVMYANNETGVIQPLEQIIKLAHEKDILIMTDGTQAVGKKEINVRDLKIDLMAFSGHKLYGPKGIGALFLNKQNKIQLSALIHGGGQENNYRSGTLNVAGIIGFGKACEIAKAEIKDNENKIKELRDFLEEELLRIDNTYLNGDSYERLFNTLNICFKGIDYYFMLSQLNDVIFSNGSACKSSSITPSHVLMAMGVSDENANCSVRFSLGKYNTLSEIKEVINKINTVINYIKKQELSLA